MKIIDLLHRRTTLSFEIFPPKNHDGDISSIYQTIDELAKLKKLYDDGVLTKKEYEAQKKKLLNQ